MPIRKAELEIYPEDLLLRDASTDINETDESGGATWRWTCLYTMSRREKDLMRRLVAEKVACYCPQVAKRYRSPAGRLRTSYIPLFTNYVFLFGNEDHRRFALTTNCISKTYEVRDANFQNELRQIQVALNEEVPLTAEAKLDSGQRVRVRSGPFKDFEGEIIRREGKTRLLLQLNYLQQGVSMEMDEALLAPI